MKKTKLRDILAEYHHNDIVILREELAAMKAKVEKIEKGKADIPESLPEGFHPEVFNRTV